MVDPGLRVDEGLDHQDHAEERQRGEPGRETQHEEHRKGQLVEGGEPCRPCRVDERHLVLVLEQLDRELPGIDLEQPRVEEHGADRDPHGELDQRERDALEGGAGREQGVDGSAQRGHALVSGLSIAITRPALTNRSSACPGSNVALMSSARSAAAPMVTPSATAERKTKSASARRSMRNSPRAPRISSCTSAALKA